ncbi:O-antigen ligase family protein [Vibrio cholerae]|uniref:O-antigen ligase family protein n=1 Tax=Vibrio TaxID=662 RepID=UPI00028D3795|nr:MULTISPECIES: O-antigen ligase family protein [Vibrio]EKG91361.1 O-Antigen Polymerase family protein [Vibrio paracholerae HE-16]MEB5520075.1 O-antigen ligase family protein [Vibrio cholerae]
MNKTHSNLILGSAFFVPALLLMTKNGSVGIVALLTVYALYYFYVNKPFPKLSSFDWLVITVLSSYFIINIPITILDGTTLRYFQGGSRLLLCIPIYFLFSFTFKEIESFKNRLSQGVIVGSIGAFLLAIYQFFWLEMPRVDGFLYSINFGYLSCALAFIALCLASGEKYRALLIIASLLNMFSTLLTLTRGAIFAIPLLLIVLTLLYWSKLNKKQFIAAFCLCSTLLIPFYTFIPQVQKRLDYTFSEFKNIKHGDYAAAESSGTRLYLWKAAVEAYKVNPWIGLPYHEREKLNKELYTQGQINEYARDLTRGHAHNQYFEMLASTGSLSLLGIFFMLLMPFTVFLKHYRMHHSIWGLTGSVFVAGFIIYGLTEAPLQANLISTFYGFMLATFFAMIRIEKHRLSVINKTK